MSWPWPGHGQAFAWPWRGPRPWAEWAETRYNHGRWFFGDRADPAWPWSGGYSLGYQLVRRTLAERGTTASEDATLSAEEAWPVLSPILEALVMDKHQAVG